MPISISSNFSKGENKIFEFTIKGDPEFLLPVFLRIEGEWKKNEFPGDVEIIEDKGSVTARYKVPEKNEYLGPKFFDFFSNVYEISKM